METVEIEGEAVYDLSWFERRAYKSIKKIEDGIWDYSDSLLLYLPSSDNVYEEVQVETNPYHELVTAPERSYLEQIAPELVAELPDNFEYIDLGPGTEHKEQFIFNAAKEQSKKFTYLPVDISSRYLQLAAEHAVRQNIDVQPIRSPFEEAVEALGRDSKRRFVSLGLTYSNYNPGSILKLLKELAGDGKAFINSQIRERIDTERLRQIYTDVALPMSMPKLELIRLKHNDVEEINVTDEVKVWCTVTETNEALERIGVRSGDTMLLFQSLRPTLEELESSVVSEFKNYKMFDNGQTFVGVLLN